MIRDSHVTVHVGITLLIAAAAIAVAVLFSEKVSRKMPDIAVPWTTAARAQAAEPLYRTDDGHYQFKYLPAFAILAIPLALVSLQTAKAVWFVVSVALLVVLMVQSLALLPERRRPAWALIVITMVVMAKFYGHELVLGQMNIPFAVVATGAVLAARRGHEWMTGLLIALAVVIKPYGVIFLPWLVARRRAGSIAAAVVGSVVIIALPAVVYGLQSDVQLHRDWWRTVTASTAPNLTNADNVSIAGMWTKWIGFGRPAAILAAATSARRPGAGHLHVRASTPGAGARCARGVYAPDVDPAALAAGVGLCLSRLDTGDHAAGELRRPASASGSAPDPTGAWRHCAEHLRHHGP